MGDIMERGKARVQVWKSAKYGDHYCIYIPQSIVQLEKIQQGNTVDFTIENKHPEIVQHKKSRFEKKEIPEQ